MSFRCTECVGFVEHETKEEHQAHLVAVHGHRKPHGICVHCHEPANWDEPCGGAGSTTTHDLGATPRPRKFDSGKLRYDLVDPFALAWLASTLTYGVAKYAAENWRLFSKEELRSKYGAAMIRHFEAWRMGEDDDEETGLPHLALGSFSAMCLTATFAPRDLKIIVEKTAEAIRRWRVIEAAKKTEAADEVKRLEKLEKP